MGPEHQQVPVNDAQCITRSVNLSLRNFRPQSFPFCLCEMMSWQFAFFSFFSFQCSLTPSRPGRGSTTTNGPNSPLAKPKKITSHRRYKTSISMSHIIPRYLALDYRYSRARVEAGHPGQKSPYKSVRLQSCRADTICCVHGLEQAPGE